MTAPSDPADHPTTALGAEPAAPDLWTLRLYVAGQTARSMTAFANLQKICKEHLAGFKVPRYIEIIDGDFPRSPIGKVLKKTLREWGLKGAPKEAKSEATVADITNIEENLREIRHPQFKRVLLAHRIQ